MRHIRSVKKPEKMMMNDVIDEAGGYIWVKEIKEQIKKIHGTWFDLGSCSRFHHWMGMFYTGWSLDRTCRWTAPTVSGISGRRSFNDRGRIQLFLYDRKIPGSGGDLPMHIKALEELLRTYADGCCRLDICLL